MNRCSKIRGITNHHRDGKTGYLKKLLKELQNYAAQVGRATITTTHVAVVVTPSATRSAITQSADTQSAAELVATKLRDRQNSVY